MRRLLTIAAVFLALGPGAAGAAAQYPATASFSASDSPDLWNAAGGGSSVAIALGGTVSFDVATSEPHDASFPAPSGVACTAGGGPVVTRIPSTPSASWSGSCTFSEPGYRAFVCTVHSGMTGEVAVAGADGVLPPRYPDIQADPERRWARSTLPAPTPGRGSARRRIRRPPPGLLPLFTFARTQRGTTCAARSPTPAGRHRDDRHHRSQARPQHARGASRPARRGCGG